MHHCTYDSYVVVPKVCSLRKECLISMNKIAEFVKRKRKEAGLTQEEFSVRSGLGLRFVRDLEQGKETVRMDKVNTALAMFDMEAVPGRKENDE